MTIPMQVLPEEMYATAREFSRLGRDTAVIKDRLSSRWHRLDAGWESFARQDVDGRYHQAMRELNIMAETMAQIAVALTKTANLIEDADNSAARIWSQPPRKPQRHKRAGIVPTPKEGILSKGKKVIGNIISGGVKFVDDVTKDGRKIVKGAVEFGEDSLAWVRNEGVSALDSVVANEIDKQLPPNGKGEEYTGYKAEGKLTIPGPVISSPVDVYVEGGSDIRLTRDYDGNIVVSIDGIGGVGVAPGVGDIAELDAGLRGRAQLEMIFDPDNPGDMSALLAFLATTGGIGLLASSDPLQKILGAGVLTTTGTGLVVGGEQVQFIDNVSQVKMEGGAAVAVAGEVDISVLEIDGEAEFDLMRGAGYKDFEGDDQGLRPVELTRLSFEAEGELGIGDIGIEEKRGIGVELEIEQTTDHPRHTEVVLALEGQAGMNMEMLEADLGGMGLDLELEYQTTASGRVEVTFATDVDAQAILDCYDAETGQFDFSPVVNKSSIEVEFDAKIDNSLELELGVSAGTNEFAFDGEAGVYKGYTFKGLEKEF